MKHLTKTYLIFLLLSFSISACKDDDDAPDTPNYGAEFFKCKINGEDFQARSIPWQCTGTRFDYYPEAHLNVAQGFMLLRGRDCYESRSVAIRMYGYQGATGLINFVDPVHADSISPFYRNFDEPFPEGRIFENLEDGWVHIDELIPRASGNAPLGNIKGSFEFTVTDALGLDTIRVTEGSFQFRVPQIF